MSTIVEKPVNPLAFWLALLVTVTFTLGGLGLRVVRDDTVFSPYIDGETEQQLMGFLSMTGLPGARMVHYTRDAGIRGLQVALPGCDGYLQIAVMPEGDEFLGLWNIRAQSSGYQTSFLFKGRLYDHFPSGRFWVSTMAYSLIRRLQITGYSSPGSVLAMAYPKGCLTIQAVPWHRFIPVSRTRLL